MHGRVCEGKRERRCSEEKKNCTAQDDMHDGGRYAPASVQYCRDLRTRGFRSMLMVFP